jgi:hypothetical protein
MYDLAVEQRGILIEGNLREKRIIHKSTGGDLTYWADIIDYLEGKEDRTGRQCIIRIPWTGCPWITQESINEELELNYNAPWYVDQEYNCLNVPRGGHFFDQAKLHVLGKDGIPASLFDDQHLTPTNGGLDFNGRLVGHILEIGTTVGDNIFLMEEIRFEELADIREWICAHPTIMVEVEGKPETGAGGHNAGYADSLHALDTPCIYNFWENNSKQLRLSKLHRSHVWVHPNCKWFIRNFKEATFDPKPASDILLKKTNTQHGLDGCLHLIHEMNRLDFAPTSQPVSDNIFDRGTLLWG